MGDRYPDTPRTHEEFVGQVEYAESLWIKVADRALPYFARDHSRWAHLVVEPDTATRKHDLDATTLEQDFNELLDLDPAVVTTALKGHCDIAFFVAESIASVAELRPLCIQMSAEENAEVSHALEAANHQFRVADALVRYAVGAGANQPINEIQAMLEPYVDAVRQVLGADYNLKDRLMSLPLDRSAAMVGDLSITNYPTVAMRDEAPLQVDVRHVVVTPE